MEPYKPNIEIFENGVPVNEEDKKIKKRILIIIIPILIISIFLIIVSFNSGLKCSKTAKTQAAEFVKIGNEINKNGMLTGGKTFTLEQVYAYKFDECAKNIPLAQKKVFSFLVGFLAETFLLFLYLWIIDKKDKVISLLQAVLVAAYLSVIFSLGISAFIIGGVVGWGFTERVLNYSWIKTLLLTLGSIAIYYGIILLLLKFSW